MKPQKKEAPRGQGNGAVKRLREVTSPFSARQASLLAFISRPSLKTFMGAFPHLAGRDLSFSEWLALNHDSLPEPQSFSEWIATIYDAISPEEPAPSEHSTEGKGVKK
jgi:hypothetical protein